MIGDIGEWRWDVIAGVAALVTLVFAIIGGSFGIYNYIQKNIQSRIKETREDMEWRYQGRIDILLRERDTFADQVSAKNQILQQKAAEHELALADIRQQWAEARVAYRELSLKYRDYQCEMESRLDNDDVIEDLKAEIVQQEDTLATAADKGAELTAIASTHFKELKTNNRELRERFVDFLQADELVVASPDLRKPALRTSGDRPFSTVEPSVKDALDDDD